MEYRDVVSVWYLVYETHEIFMELVFSKKISILETRTPPVARPTPSEHIVVAVPDEQPRQSHQQEQSQADRRSSGNRQRTHSRHQQGRGAEEGGRSESELVRSPQRSESTRNSVVEFSCQYCCY